jgi:hypothetical protein
MEKRIILAISMLIFMSMAVSFVSAVTAINANGRMVLYPQIGPSGTTIEKTIKVSNVDNEPINITLKADENLSSIVKIIDDKFVLQPGEDRKARFNIVLTKPGYYEGKINVYFQPSKGGNGVVLPSVIIIYASKSGEDVGDNADNNSTTSGGDMLGKLKANSGAIFGVIFTIVLVIVFISLIFMWKKKKVKKRVGRSG